MLGSTAPVIPPASEEPEGALAAPAAGLATRLAEPLVPAVDAHVDLSTLVDQIRALARPRSIKLDALLNNSCRAISWQDGVLTLGFYADAYQKKTVEEAQNRRVYEEIASSIFGQPVSLRCVVAPRPARAIGNSPLVQHAVQNHGAKIVSEE